MVAELGQVSPLPRYSARRGSSSPRSCSSTLSPSSWAPGSYRSRLQTAPQWPRPLGSNLARLVASRSGSSGTGSKPRPFRAFPCRYLPTPDGLGPLELS